MFEGRLAFDGWASIKRRVLGGFGMSCLPYLKEPNHVIFVDENRKFSEVTLFLDAEGTYHERLHRNGTPDHWEMGFFTFKGRPEDSEHSSSPEHTFADCADDNAGGGRAISSVMQGGGSGVGGARATNQTLLVQSTERLPLRGISIATRFAGFAGEVIAKHLTSRYLGGSEGCH
ncbi:hypothetical protein CEXT_513031 [Caerostris extrusa]|uniref:Uncharacterized protein n=1 Tax=Caerostris extrusa TaxID=172846 RepID=A0AAV4NGB4_CAEEX|nr:hypothetical protein CEXT_513031 [Caerostris extrusa]